MSPWTWTAAARSHVGHVRAQNEDDYLSVPEQGLFVVADGMGGHAAGEVASRIAVDTLEERLTLRGNETGGESQDSDDGDVLAAAIREANRRIHGESRDDPERSGMGTTVTALRLRGGGDWTVGHVGDSRCYLSRQGELERVSRDHTWVQQQVEAGRLTPEQARGHPASSMLTRALGTGSEVNVDRYRGELREGDLFVLASDGLTDMLSDEALGSLLASGRGPDELADRLVEAALDAGGRDNVTVVLVLARREA